MKDIEEIVSSGNCAGCGLCLSVDAQRSPDEQMLEMRKTRSGHFRPRYKSGCGTEHEHRRHKRARVQRTSTRMASGLSPPGSSGSQVSHTLPSARPGSFADSSNVPAMHVSAPEKSAAATLGPLSMSSIQFNIGMHGSNFGKANAGGPSGKGRGLRQQRRRREPSKVTLGACIGTAMLQSAKGKSDDRQHDSEAQEHQHDDWPALPKASPVKLTFAQALKGIAVAKPAQPSSASDGQRPEIKRAEDRPQMARRVFQFGQKGRQATSTT